jgi:hypothetical protein
VAGPDHAEPRLDKDYDATVAGLILSFSNGPTEGVNTKIKLLKRQHTAEPASPCCAKESCLFNDRRSQWAMLDRWPNTLLSLPRRVTHECRLCGHPGDACRGGHSARTGGYATRAGFTHNTRRR